ncbi:FHA domain-containing protein [Cellulomonas sp. H30R-01]|uniref:FHA domain-containing protein FhaB/FipA n=1 Tax=Cellulomonas sp. H30R-01 TaxID=2704467 RepID=UPI00138C83FD|nr:FHA domain-containing protein [Cellulomonas sp. H30R-01]QHT57485.1 FHA domain-containing protein [Cellulomonas sp. H30R-01]
MSELTITLLRLGYLALLWVLVLSAIGVLRRDLYGTRITDRRRANRAASAAPARPQPVDAAAVAPTPAAAPAPAASAPVRTPRAARSGSGPRKLVVTEGPLRGTIVPLGSAPVLIGRAPSCTLVLDDDYSSSRHARVFPQDGQWFVEDLGSTNGTFLADQRVDGPIPLPTGTPVRVGQSVLELQR